MKKALRGYAVNPEQFEALLKHGVQERAIKRAWLPLQAFGDWQLRIGETLCVAGGLEVFGGNRKQMRAAVDAVQSWGAEIEDVTTGNRTDAKGAQMLDDAITRVHGEATIGSAERAREMQLASAEARRKNKEDGRMRKREALAHWRNPDLTNSEALALMTGWTAADAYKELEKRGVGTGRPRKS